MKGMNEYRKLFQNSTTSLNCHISWNTLSREKNSRRGDENRMKD